MAKPGRSIVWEKLHPGTKGKSIYVSRKQQLNLMIPQTKLHVFCNLLFILISTSYNLLLIHILLLLFIVRTYHVTSIRVVKHFKYLLPVAKEITSVIKKKIMPQTRILGLVVITFAGACTCFST